MRRLPLIVLSFPFLLVACGLLPPVDVQDAFGLDGTEVTLTTQKRRVLPSGSLGIQVAESDPNAECNTNPLPQDCEIVASNFGNANKAVVVNFDNLKNTPKVFSTLTSTLGLGSSVTVIVPPDISQEQLPATLTISRAKLRLQLFDGKLTAEEALTAAANSEMEAVEVSNINRSFTFESCEPNLESATQQACTYKTTDAAKFPELFNLTFGELTKLFDILTKGEQKNTALLEFEAAFVPFKSNLQNRDNFPSDAGMRVIVNEGATKLTF